MNSNRKHEAISRLLWLVENEVGNLPQKEDDYDGDQSWIDEYNQEMNDALAIAQKMYHESRVELITQKLTKEYRAENPDTPYSYDQLMTHYRREVKKSLAEETSK